MFQLYKSFHCSTIEPLSRVRGVRIDKEVVSSILLELVIKHATRWRT